VYRCIPHGGQQDGIEVCVALQNGRILGEKQRSTIPMTELLCGNQWVVAPDHFELGVQ
jgi:hypothetical protein